ncbi:MAG: GNAT family N-acetyltransferase [Chloroflexi bacterium]|nr:GNAT family N-acetyltransferase [Chloroflexota bacterium]
MTKYQILTAETELGQQALTEVMERSYVSDIDSVPPAWARVLVADDEPVSFIVVDPARWMEYPGGDLPYAFICDVATREDRQGEGHFRAIMEDTFASLHAAGVSLVVTHGRYPLYRRFGFDVFTHHSGIFVTPEQIERELGVLVSERAKELLVVDENRYLHEDMLLVTDVRATIMAESKQALQTAAMLARERTKSRIMFEYPPAPSYGSRYPICPLPETPFVALARACGAQVCVQGAAPEEGEIPDADWIKVLDSEAFLREVLKGMEKPTRALPKGTIGFDTDAGAVTIKSVGGRVTVSSDDGPDTVRVTWPSAALAQLVTGYKSIEVLCAVHSAEISDKAMTLLGELFPPRWRFSRNESWTYKS